MRVPIDDAFISFRYARNLVEGTGLVYNPGEYVEGITNLLWTLLVAGGIVSGFDAVAASQTLEIVMGIALLVATVSYARTILRERSIALAALAAVVVCAAPSFAYWSTAGLGEAFFVALVTATLAAEAAGRPAWMTAAAVTATLMRPEGGLVAIISFAFSVSRRGAFSLAAWRGPVAYAIAMAILTGFRLGYYGSPVPNTFYAKVGGVPVAAGVQYLWRFLADGALPLALLAVPAVLCLPATRPAAVLVAATAAYVVAIGGDVFPFGRFLLPTLPALATLALAGVAVLWDRQRWLGGLAFSGIVFAVACARLGPLPFAPNALWPPARWPQNVALAKQWQAEARLIRNAATGGRRLAAVGAHRGAPPLVATGMIGAFGYYSRLPIVDFLGLVDRVIAHDRRPPPPGALLLPGHQRSNPDYVLARKPDYILLPPQVIAPSLPAAIDLAAHPEFARWYEWDRSVPAWRRRSEAEVAQVAVPRSVH